MTPALVEALDDPPAHGLVVALSGGRDSVSLLHALHARYPGRVSAAHVHHGLQPAADDFAAHCTQLCAAWQVPLRVHRVQVSASGAGIEADARRVRYAALAEAVGAGAVLVAAHHAGDQAETVLMRVLRGTGPDGLAGMRRMGATREGTPLWRPWLTVASRQIDDYARAHALRWVDDPHNRDLAFTRVWLRQRLMPEIESRYPAAQAALGRLAALMAEHGASRPALSERPTDWGPCWPADEAARLDDASRRHALRDWLRRHIGQVPSAAMLARIECEVLRAGKGRHPSLRVNGVTLRRHRNGLYATDDLPALPAATWSDAASVVLAGWGWFAALSAPASTITVRAARPGERLRPAGSDHHQRLTTLMQARGVPAWLRQRVPVLALAHSDTAVALADWVVSDQAPPGLQWQPAPGWTGAI